VGWTKPLLALGALRIIRLDNSLPARRALATALVDAGCEVEMKDPSWQTAGDFSD
jgi:hypothetical protein